MSERRGLGALEGEVLARLWASDVALSAADVRAAVGEDLAYTTVITVLSRLWQKGLASRELHGRAYFYTPVMSEAQLTAQRMLEQFERANDRKGTLASFVSGLSRREEHQLRRILESMDRH